MKIDESKIVEGQLEYVIKLMKLAKQEGYEKCKKDVLKEIDNWAYDNDGKWRDVHVDELKERLSGGENEKRKKNKI